MNQLFELIKKNKKVIIAAVAVLAVLIFTFWYGNGTKESRGFSVNSGNEETTLSLENVTEKLEETTGEKRAEGATELIGQKESASETLENGDKDGTSQKDDGADNSQNQGGLNASTDHEGSSNNSQQASDTSEPAGNFSGGNNSTAVENTTAAENNSEAAKTFSVTLSINCATVLNNMDKLKENKKDMIPSDGWILNTVTVQMTEGETVYDALIRACKANGILTDAEYTPMYGTYYLKGIGNLYQMDCGSTSGWLYLVNGTSASVGASSYSVKSGDVIQWLYTCNMGKDL